MELDYKEIIYRKIVSLDENREDYYTIYFRNLNRLLNEQDRQHLKEIQVKICKQFEDSEERMPDFHDVAIWLSKGRFNENQFQKLRTKDGYRRVFYREVMKEVNELMEWCEDKLIEATKDIRFSRTGEIT